MTSEIAPDDEYIKNLKEQLRNRIVTVKFRKVDGEIRVMQCTLQPSIIPQYDEIKEGSKPKKKNDSVVSVWDVEKEGWRSFRTDSVISFEVTIDTKRGEI